MPYIGNQPAEQFTSFATQEFSTSATTSYTLDHAVTNENEIALFINNVRQQPGSGKAYTATGTTLTLSAATASTDTMYCVFLGRALQTVTPATNSITGSMINYPLTTFSSTGIDDNADATAMTITSAEKIGIGTSSPQEDLSINVDLNDTEGIGLQYSNETKGGIKLNPSGGEIRMGSLNSTGTYFTTIYANNAERMRLNTTDVLIGSTSSFSGQGDDGAFLSSSGGIFDFARNVGGGSSVFRVSGSSGETRVQGDGDLINTNNSYGAISDRQLKENEANANSQWDDIKALQIKNYNLKTAPNIKHLGVVAQDLESSGMNGLVVTDDNDYKSVKYSVLYMKAVKALQEAMERIETLENKVKALEDA